MRELFEQLLPNALTAGIDILCFWDMTIGEILDVIQNYNKQREEETKLQVLNNYHLATMITDFIGRSMNKKSIPTIYEMYPDLFGKEQQQITNRDELAAGLLREQWIDFALYHNKKRKDKGGENN